jgi:ubiquinone/menaquinone biosynthesis C-methylase UbiE
MADSTDLLSTYVLDLLSDDDIRAVVNEARRVLRPDGLLAL